MNTPIVSASAASRRQKKYYEGKGKETSRIWYENHKEEKRAKMREYQRKRRELFKMYEAQFKQNDS